MYYKYITGGSIMAPRRQTWTLSETRELIANFDRPIQDLVKLFPRHPQASINRKISRLRADGKIGHKSDDTKKLAYKLRGSKEETA